MRGRLISPAVETPTCCDIKKMPDDRVTLFISRGPAIQLRLYRETPMEKFRETKLTGPSPIVLKRNFSSTYDWNIRSVICTLALMKNVRKYEESSILYYTPVFFCPLARDGAISSDQQSLAAPLLQTGLNQAVSRSDESPSIL